MSGKLLFLAAVLLSTVGRAIHGADRTFTLRPVTVDDGLSQSHVTTIVQDKQGFIWVGTAEGLNRYDGREFRIYTHHDDDPKSLSSDAVYALHVDSRGRVWVGTSRGLDTYEPATDDFRHMNIPRTDSVGRRFRVRSIDSDKSGNIWVSLYGYSGSVAHIDAQTNALKRYDLAQAGLNEPVFIRSIDEDRTMIILRDTVGASFRRGFAVLLLSPKTGQFTEIQPDSQPYPRPFGVAEREITLAQTGPTSFWIGAPGTQVYDLDLSSNEIRPFIYSSDLHESRYAGLISHVVAGKAGTTWIIPTWARPGQHAGSNKIYSVAHQDRSVLRSSLKPAASCDFTRSNVISSLTDQTGVLWTGLAGAGMCVADLESGMFSHIHQSSPDVAISNNFVRSIWKTPSGILWVGTLAGLNRLDRNNAKSTEFHHDPAVKTSLSDDQVMSVLVDRNNTLWVGTQRGGLNQSTRDGVFRRFMHDPDDPGTLTRNHVTSLLEDRNGILWVGTVGGGLNRYHGERNTFTAFRHSPEDSTTVSSDKITALFEDSTGQMWVGTEDAGLNRFDRQSGRFTQVGLGFSEPANIVSLTEDPAAPGVIWIATLNRGLVRLDARAHTMKWFNMKNSLLPSDTVYLVISDTQGAVWAGTNRGLARIDAKDELFRIFGKDQGLQSAEFNTRAAFRARDGEMFFGGVGGLNSFYPKDITQNGFPAKVVITDVRSLDRSGSTGHSPYRSVYRNDGSPAEGSFGYGTRDFVFDFVALHYADPSKNVFRFILEGFDRDWRDAGATRSVSYTNLPAGNYRFRVRAATSRGVWSESDAVYKFTISPPLYQSAWFLSLAAMVVMAALVSSHRFRLRSLEGAKRRLEEQVQQRTTELTNALALIGNQSEKLRDAAELKSRFITNVSHDFRTPLTITMGTLEDICSGLYGPVSEDVQKEMQLVLRNERKMLRLVNQLITISRLDSGNLKLNVVKCDLRTITQEVVSACLPFARRRQVELRCHAEAPLEVFCDPEWMEQAVTNLVINALKFSPPGREVRVSLSQDPETGRACIAVEDQGPGIPAAEIGKIFDRYYQTELGATVQNAGVGVGLSLAREIVMLHSGEILVTSEPGLKTVFRILLNTGEPEFATATTLLADQHSEVASDTPDVPEPSPEPVVTGTSDRPAVLVAEDDVELRGYITKHLDRDYRVLTADTGGEAWNLVKSETPDLVISDIMMPGVDGYQLCRNIRSSPETDYIPVLLLTAKAATDNKLLGLDAGADDYLTKPFDIKELKGRVRNILGSRARLRIRMAARQALDTAKSIDTIPDSADAVFVERVYEVIRANAHDEDFSVEQLADALAISRMHLYRQLRRILGKAPAEVLMEYRLERAAELLAGRCGTVSDVAYSLGFRNLSHFTRRFREKFNKTPSEYRARGNPQAS